MTKWRFLAGVTICLSLFIQVKDGAADQKIKQGRGGLVYIDGKWTWGEKAAAKPAIPEPIKENVTSKIETTALTEAPSTSATESIIIKNPAPTLNASEVTLSPKVNEEVNPVSKPPIKQSLVPEVPSNADVADTEDNDEIKPAVFIDNQKVVGQGPAKKNKFENVVPLKLAPDSLLPQLPPAKTDEFGSEKEKRKKEEAANRIGVDVVYKGCGKKKGCVGDPPQCVAERSCQSLISYGNDKQKVRFQIMGKAAKFIAIGISRDQLMGDDCVVECVREGDDEIKAYMSWNFKHDNKREKIQNVVSGVRGSFVDGNIVCEFWLDRVIRTHGKIFDLVQDKFFVLQARGNNAKDGPEGNVLYHDEGAGSSKEQYNLDKQFYKSKLRIIFEKVHSALMLFAWFFFFPLGAFISRYYKETYVNKEIRGYTIWYSWHVLLNWSGALLVFGGIACEYGTSQIPPGEGREGWNFHCISGIILTGIIFIQIILGYVIKKLNLMTSSQVVNVLHGILGHTSCFIAFTNVWMSTEIEMGMPCDTRNVLVGWIVVYFVVHLFMSYLVCYVDFIRGSHISRAYNIAHLRMVAHPEGEDITGSSIRKAVLCFFILVSAGFTLGLVALFFLDLEMCVPID